DMITEIRALEPRPAAAFDTTPPQPLVPDVLMRPLPDAGPGGGWALELSAEALPRVLIDRTYYATVNAAVTDKAERRFLTEKLQSANWLVKALDQRATTILRVATEIVRLQHDFFLHGVQHLRPLVLRDVASEIDMHESTVSRATTNKYMATPRGIFELKYFFSSAIADSAGGSAHSAETVRQRIKALVDAEPASQVLSDDSIVTLLRREGYGIARRTVAKYRESMRIPSSVERRRQKSLTNSLSGNVGP
ncbi:MAG: RNA polymerase sigma-54 factor, partial [Pseudomonadota bacterium]